MREKVRELEQKRQEALKMGGEKALQKQHKKGKLSARERIQILLDEGTFLEFGMLAGHHPMADGVLAGKNTAADGVITGYGKLNGRYVGVAAYDFTVLGGSMGAVGEIKMTRLRELVLRHRIPIIWLIDSAGARIHEFSLFPPTFAGSGALFREQSIMSGVIPQVCAMVGPGAAGTAYIPGLADFVPMVKGTSHMALGGPPLVKAATGEDISEEELGGSRIHCQISGVADLEVPDDEACMKVIGEYLSYFPSHCEEKPPILPWNEPVGLLDETFLDLVPTDPRRPYDMHKVIEQIVDHGKYFEIKPQWAKNLITCFARIGGYPVGILANQPKVWGGILDVNSADKGARFIQICDAFQIPLVFFQDVPGFMVGSKVEKEGIISHGAKMIHCLSNARVPKLTVVVRKAYGAGYYAMCGRAYEPDLIVAWPTAEISVMGPEGMLGILSRSQLKDLDEKSKKVVLEDIRKKIDAYGAARIGFVDDVIHPLETRQVLFQALEASWNKMVERPFKWRGIMPI